jgi:hypothetical protein
MAESPKTDYSTKADVSRYIDTGHVDLTTAGAVYTIVRLRGGQAVIIKALVGNTGNVYIGKINVSSSIGFELAPGESLKIEYMPDKMAGEFIDIYATSATSGDDICFILVP